jgi:hypothetical protein
VHVPALASADADGSTFVAAPGPFEHPIPNAGFSDDPAHVNDAVPASAPPLEYVYVPGSSCPTVQLHTAVVAGDAYQCPPNE